MNASENKTKRFRISIIDVLIALVVIACVAGVFLHYRTYAKNNKVVKDDTCYVSLQLSGVANETAEKITTGDTVYLKDDKSVFGKISEVNLENAQYYYSDEKGISVRGEDAYAKDVALVIEVKGELTEDGFLANGVEYVASGLYIDVYTNDFSEKGLIFGVEERSE